MFLTDSRLNHRGHGPGAGQETSAIGADQARTLCGLLSERAQRTPDGIAYLQHDAPSGRWVETTWREMAREVARWQAALTGETLDPGDRVAVMMRNRREWIAFDLAATGVGLATVPLYPGDRPGSVRHILEEAGVRLLLVGHQDQLEALGGIAETLNRLVRILVMETDDRELPENALPVPGWLAAASTGATDARPQDWVNDPNALATIVYTSGTTGTAKGVMLTHRNMLWNAEASMRLIPVYPDDRFLSFLPLSHTLERTSGSILPIMAGASVAFARSIPQLAEDLSIIRPTAMFAVPRIFERIHARLHEKLEQGPALRSWLFQQAVAVGWRAFEHAQGRAHWHPALLAAPMLDHLVGAKVRARLGGRMRVAVCGGAPLSSEIARVFIGLGVPLVQGYGLTETSPVISVNPLQDNRPESVGALLPGIEARIGDGDELLVRTPGIMQGYWQQPRATTRVIDRDGWLHTGDRARIEHDHLYITGRLKEIIVLANGEKVSPSDLELAIATDPVIEQVMIIGEGMPALTALVVPAAQAYASLAPLPGMPETDRSPEQEGQVEKALLARVEKRLADFPGQARVRSVRIVDEPWTVNNGLLTPTMKLRRSRILERYRNHRQAATTRRMPRYPRMEQRSLAYRH